MIPRSFKTALGCRNPSVVINSTRGCSGQRVRRACKIRAEVLFPTATLPAIPMTYGIFGAIAPKKVADTRCRFCVALTYKFKRRVSGKYTATTSSRSMRSLIPRRASRSRSCNVSGVCARSSAQSWRSNRKYRSTSIASIMSELPRDY